MRRQYKILLFAALFAAGAYFLSNSTRVAPSPENRDEGAVHPNAPTPTPPPAGRSTASIPVASSAGIKKDPLLEEAEYHFEADYELGRDRAEVGVSLEESLR